MLRRCGVVLWCETQLCWVLVWRYAALCPAFQWLLSKHTQRWKPSLLTHAVNEALFLLESSGHSKGRAQWLVSLSTVHSNTAWNIKHIDSVNILTMCRSRCVACELEFTDSQWSSMQITGNIDGISRRGGANKTAISNSQSIVPFYSKVQLIFFLFLAT